MNTCKTCKFWVQRNVSFPDNVGNCDQVKKLPDTLDMETLNVKKPAIFSAWFACLIVPSTFGCNLWEVK